MGALRARSESAAVRPIFWSETEEVFAEAMTFVDTLLRCIVGLRCRADATPSHHAKGLLS